MGSDTTSIRGNRFGDKSPWKEDKHWIIMSFLCLAVIALLQVCNLTIATRWHQEQQRSKAFQEQLHEAQLTIDAQDRLIAEEKRLIDAQSKLLQTFRCLDSIKNHKD